MKNLNLSLLKNLSVAFILAGGLMYSCQDNAADDTSGTKDTEDSTYTGLEGTREQSSQGGTSVVIDSSAGQSASGGSGSSTDSLKSDSMKKAK